MYVHRYCPSLQKSGKACGWQWSERRNWRMSMSNDRLTSAAIAAARPTLAVLGIGAMEQHSHHLPVGTDWIAVSEVCRRVAAELDAFLLPAIPFSMSECHGPMEGTVWLKPSTLAAV